MDCSADDLVWALMQAKVSGQGLAPDSRAAVRALLCSREEWEASAAVSPVRWLQDAVLHQLVPSALSLFHLPRNASLEHVVTQVRATPGSHTLSLASSIPTGVSFRPSYSSVHSLQACRVCVQAPYAASPDLSSRHLPVQ